MAVKSHQCNKPSVAHLKEMFTLGGPTGLIWASRPPHHFTSPKSAAIFRAKNQGKPAGSATKNGYWSVGVNGRLIGAHQIVLAIKTGAWAVTDVDHVDGNKSNNTPSNLREASRSENIVNADPKKARSATGVRNVYKNKHGYVVQVWKNGRCHSGGSFKTLAEASSAAHLLKTEIYKGFDFGR